MNGSRTTGWTRITALAAATIASCAVSVALAQRPAGGPPPGGGSGGRQGGQSGQGGQHAGNQGQAGQQHGNASTRPTSRPSPEDLFKRADKNGDGVLSKEEFFDFLQHMPHQPPPPKGGGNNNDNS